MCVIIRFKPYPEDQLLKAFEVLDTDKKGYLTEEELAKYMMEEGIIMCVLVWTFAQVWSTLWLWSQVGGLGDCLGKKILKKWPVRTITYFFVCGGVCTKVDPSTHPPTQCVCGGARQKLPLSSGLYSCFFFSNFVCVSALGFLRQA